jgi:hypothetical protein
MKLEDTGVTQSSWSYHMVYKTHCASSRTCSGTQRSNSSRRFECPWMISYSKGRARIRTEDVMFWGNRRFEKTRCLQHDFNVNRMFINRLHKSPLLLPILSATSYSISLRCRKILSSHRRQSIRSGLFLSYYIIKCVHESLIIRIHATYSA